MAIYTSQRAIDSLVGESSSPAPIEMSGELGGRGPGIFGSLRLKRIFTRAPNSEYDAVHSRIQQAGIRINKLQNATEEGELFSATVTNTEIGTSPFLRYGGRRMVWCWWLHANIKFNSNINLIMLGSPDNDPTLVNAERPKPGFGFPSYPNSLSKLIKDELGLSQAEGNRALSESPDTERHKDPGYRLMAAESIISRGRETASSEAGYQQTWVNYNAGRTRVIGIIDSLQPSAQKYRSVLARPVIVVHA